MTARTAPALLLLCTVRYIQAGSPEAEAACASGEPELALLQAKQAQTGRGFPALFPAPGSDGRGDLRNSGLHGIVVAGGAGAGNKLDQLDMPHYVDADNEGRLYVADSNNHRVLRFDGGAATGVVVAGGNGAGLGTHQLLKPGGVTHDEFGRLYVADTENQRITRWDPGATEGVVVASVAKPGTEKIFGPRGMTYFNGSLYVADMYQHRVVRFSADHPAGELVAGSGGAGPGPQQLDTPQDVDVDVRGRILVADSGNHRVIGWEPGPCCSDGQVYAGGGQGIALHQLDNPVAVKTDGLGRIFVGDLGNHRVLRYNRGVGGNGTVVAGTAFASPSGLHTYFFPTSLSVKADGGLLIADRDNHRIVESRFAK